MKLFCKTHGVYFSHTELPVAGIARLTSAGMMAELHSRGYEGCDLQWVEEPVQ